jgi:hypothetical protein
MTYHIDNDGCPAHQTGDPKLRRGGWQEDCHTDVIHNFIDAMNAVPEWHKMQLDRPLRIGFHEAKYDEQGKLLPWTSWDDAIDREMNYYLNCPMDHGYPVLVTTTFLDGDYKPYRDDTIPCTLDGMGIVSYLKYWEYRGKSNAKVLEWAKKMGDYLVKETLTPDEGAWPRFTRSTGLNTQFPMTESEQHDERFSANAIEPDKGGIAGYALVKLYDVTGEQRYLDQALQNARCLVKNMRPADAARAPWPFRVDSVSGQGWGERNGNMVFILRLFDALIEKGNAEFKEPREALWTWIKNVQIPAPEDQAHTLWIQFFEDHHEEDNRNSWSPLETARYLIEKKEALDPDWKQDAERCIRFVLNNLSNTQLGYIKTAVEQDYDRRDWGGVCSKLGGVTALFYAAGGGDEYKEMAYRNLNWCLYAIDDDGCPSHLPRVEKNRRGGWQEDCHTDVMLNFVDALASVPEWRAK